GRHHRVPSADAGADRGDRPHHAARGAPAAGGGGAEAAADGQRSEVPGGSRVRRDVRCAAAAACDSALPGGSAVGEDPRGGAPARRRDRGRRHAGRRGPGVPGAVVDEDMKDRERAAEAGETAYPTCRYGARKAVAAGERQKRTRAAALAAVLFCGGLGGASVAHAQEAAEAPPPVVGDTVRVEGSQRRPETAVLADIGIRAGDTIDYRIVQRAIHRLWASGHYADVQIFADGVEGDPAAPVTLIVRVVEQPYVAQVEFRGLESVRASTIRDTVGLSGGSPLRPAKVAEAEAMTRRLLAGKGLQARSVEHRLEEIPERPGEHRLVFEVDEGQRVAISEIEFEGNENFPDERLQKVLNTKKEGFFWFRDGTYDEDKLRSDLRETL